MRKSTALIALLVVALTGCAAKSGPEYHVRHFVYKYQQSSDPNFRNANAYSIKEGLPNFQQVYDAGKQAKAKGYTEQQVREYAEVIRCQAMQISSSQHYIESGDVEHHALPENIRKGYAEEIVATFWDGYNGK